MKIKLAPNFQHWAKKDVIWIFSDPHFNDDDCKLMNENWVSPEEQVEILNSFVHKNDILICLGDVGDEMFFRKVRGYKVLFTGNHDKGESVYKKKYCVFSKDANTKEITFHCEFSTPEEAHKQMGILAAEDFNNKYYVADNNLFDEVYTGPQFINNKVLLSHEPVELGFGLNIHGHVHNGKHEYIDPDNDYAMVNVAADVINYQPLRLDKIIEKYHTKDLHRITVDVAKERRSIERE